MVVFICGLGVLAALVPVGHGFAPKGGGWFRPAVVGGAFTLHPLLFAVPSAACFVLGLFDWRRPWRVEQLDLLGEVVPVLRRELDALRPAGVPDGPTHQARLAASLTEAATELETSSR